MSRKTIKIDTESAAFCFYPQLQRDNKGKVLLMQVAGAYVAFDDTAHIIGAALEIEPAAFCPDEAGVSFPAMLIGETVIVRFSEDEINTVIALLLENAMSVAIATQEN